MTEKHLSSKWVQHFLKQHPKINAKWTHPLDPKQACAFNPATVKAHFNMLSDVVTKYEKGIQLGGGHKASTAERIFAATDKNNYVLKCDDLLLITIIETICADGTAYPPGIVMPPGATGEWYKVPGIAW
ncbi:hypothetical protein M422DRAFT_244014 [Sphaerobolus stellatus SS14]|nr:hypothetical protein M422DRAFT_244014 [Sphaerobolus stellatus SS14]